MVGGEWIASSWVIIWLTNIACQTHSAVYPTLARIALDILPIAAASVGAEALFSQGKEVLTDRRSRLDPELFEQVQCLNFAWKPTIVDWARLNDQLTVDVYLQEFEFMYAEEVDMENDSDVDSE